MARPDRAQRHYPIALRTAASPVPTDRKMASAADKIIDVCWWAVDELGAAAPPAGFVPCLSPPSTPAGIHNSPLCFRGVESYLRQVQRYRPGHILSVFV